MFFVVIHGKIGYGNTGHREQGTGNRVLEEKTVPSTQLPVPNPLYPYYNILMALNANGIRLPHALRLIIFFLRIALGFNFLFLGLGKVFGSGIPRQYATGKALSDLSTWLATASSAATPLGVAFTWMCIIIGICLIVGFLARLAAIGGIALLLASVFPGMTGFLEAQRFVSEGVIATLCLLILIITNAGSYLGLDHFVRWGRKD